MVPRLLVCALVSAAVGCGGVTAAGSPDASTDALVADARVVIDGTAPPPLITDSGSEEADSLDAGPFEDVSPLLPFDASLPAPPSCDAGSYFVTIVDGAGVRILDEECADAGAWAVPALVSYSCGNLCGFSQVEACGGGLSLMLRQTYPPAYGSPALSFTVSASFDDGSGNLLQGMGTIEFSAPPFAAGALGTTLAGSYTQTLSKNDGPPVGAIAGTFCVLDGW
jgi:hypothetical protein